MLYKITARHPGRGVTYSFATEEAALEKWDELTADGIPFDMSDENGPVESSDLEDRIDARPET